MPTNRWIRPDGQWIISESTVVVLPKPNSNGSDGCVEFIAQALQATDVAYYLPVSKLAAIRIGMVGNSVHVRAPTVTK